jgi:hypothetical protein
MQTANWQEIEEAKKAALKCCFIMLTDHTRDFRIRQAGAIRSRIQGI